MLIKGSVLVSIFAFMFVFTSSLYAVGSDDLLGIWKTEKDLSSEGSKITIYKCGDRYCGRISWLRNPEILDSNNKDEEKRNRKLLGLDMIFGFEFEDDEWENGNIYNPQNGKTYSSAMSLEGMDILKVKGCVAFFCKSITWYRE